MFKWRRALCYSVFILLVIIKLSESKLRKKKAKKKPETQGTGLLSFLGLLTLRMIYGFATMLGMDEALQEFMGGILVPPGVEDDYRDYGADDGEEDY